jgi:hypothetical protein
MLVGRIPPLGTFTRQVNTGVSQPTSHIIMCVKSRYGRRFLLFITSDRIPIKSAILPVPTEMYRIELNEFIVLHSPLESEAMKM